MKHIFPIRVYYEDTDAAGVVYYANYMKYAERGRTEFLRHIGFENTQLAKENSIAFVVKHVTADYIIAARLDDNVSMETALTFVKNASFGMEQNLKNTNGDLLFSMLVTLACVDTNDMKPAKLPTAVKEKFQSMLNGSL